MVTCPLDARVGELRGRVSDSPFGFALVVSGDRVLLGRLRRAALEHEPSSLAEEVMEAGPSTVRPDRDASELAEALRAKDLKTAIVTTPDGRLVGVVRAADLP